jgi:cytochrome c biogenesis protein ResB
LSGAKHRANTRNAGPNNSAWYFYGLLALLGASLIACTATTQWPAAKARGHGGEGGLPRGWQRMRRTVPGCCKAGSRSAQQSSGRARHAEPRAFAAPSKRPQVAQRWRFAADPKSVQRSAGAPAVVLPNARLRDLGSGLAARGYQVFLQGPQLYAFKGLAGRLGPIGVHAALILALGGTAYSSFGGWKGSALVPEGQEFLVAQAISPVSAISRLPRGASTVLHVNGFSIETRPDGSVSQFYSDLSLRDLDSGDELLRKTISVNDPFRWGRRGRRRVGLSRSRGCS